MTQLIHVFCFHVVCRRLHRYQTKAPTECYPLFYLTEFTLSLAFNEKQRMNILVIGSGGREHALAWKIRESPLCQKVYVAPGNAGTSLVAENVTDRCE